MAAGSNFLDGYARACPEQFYWIGCYSRPVVQGQGLQTKRLLGWNFEADTYISFDLLMHMNNKQQLIIDPSTTRSSMYQPESEYVRTS